MVARGTALDVPLLGNRRLGDERSNRVLCASINSMGNRVGARTVARREELQAMKIRMLKYTWDDLTGINEINDIFIDKIRITFLQIQANGDPLNYIKNLMDSEIGYIFCCPGSDFCSILYRLFEKLPADTVRTAHCINSSLACETPISIHQFMEMVRIAHSTRSIPTILGMFLAF